MIKRRDWMEHNHLSLYNQSNLTATYLADSANRTRMGIEGANASWYQNTFVGAHSAFKSAYEAWADPATRTQTHSIALSDTQKAFESVYRQLYAGMLKNNPNVADTDLVQMGLPARRTPSHNPVPVPDTIPEAEVKLPSPGVVEIHFRDSGAERRAKPAGVHGVEIAWSLRDTPPNAWSDLQNTAIDTNTPFKMQFDLIDRGKKVYFALRWENTRGEKGPWSEPSMIIIP